MRLAAISNTRGYAWAGSEVLWHSAALQALRDGHQVTAFTSPEVSHSRQVGELLAAGAELHTWRPCSVTRLQPIIDKFRPNFPVKMLDGFDSVLVSLGSLPALCYVPGLANSLKRVVSPFLILCQFNAEHLFISPDERTLVRELIARSAACLFVSARNLATARRQFASELPAATVICNPVRNSTEGPLPWPKIQHAHFACVARCETAWKGQDLLLEVLAREAWRQRGWHLNFYGTGPDLDHLQRLVNFFRLAGRVTFHGHVEELPAIWSNNHILLLPSHGEGTPLAALEAMMSGRPAVVTDVGGNSEILEEGTSGFIAEAATVHSFGAALERAWKARLRWQEIGITAHKKATMLAATAPERQLLIRWLASARFNDVTN